MIPDVKYNAQKRGDTGIEYIDLDAFYKRFPFKNHDPSKPHRVHFNNLILITKGTGTHFVDFHEYPVKPGSIIYVSRNQVHAFDFDRKPLGKMLLITPRFIDQLRTEIRLPFFAPHHIDATAVPVFSIRQQQAHSCEVLMDEIHLALGSTQESALVRLLFAALSFKTFGERPDELSRKFDEHRIQNFRTFIERVEAHFTETREAAAYAEMMHTTYKTLNELCKSICGKTAKQVIDSHTVLEAKRRLAIEGIRVEELSADLGFDEPTNFVKYFKKHASITPAKFKKQFAG
ncbi:helix-turn-helix transcriptional regulator [Pontiellaceae bacterium B12219]|nr:helix-turn-helix transcriptional regulator [Pontiellaceae bacterium B12219]